MSAPVLHSTDLVVTIIARAGGDERPNIGFMIEQSKGVGITSLATHEDGVKPVQRCQMATGAQCCRSRDSPLHSGDYVIMSTCLTKPGWPFTTSGSNFWHFSFIFPQTLAGASALAAPLN